MKPQWYAQHFGGQMTLHGTRQEAEAEFHGCAFERSEDEPGVWYASRPGSDETIGEVGHVPTTRGEVKGWAAAQEAS